MVAPDGQLRAVQEFSGKFSLEPSFEARARFAPARRTAVGCGPVAASAAAHECRLFSLSGHEDGHGR